LAEQQPTEEQLNAARMLALIDMLATGALTALGKLADPSSGKEPPVMLDQARFMIDILEALEVKTKGNLSDYEKRALETQLTSLRLTFVEEVNRQKKGGGAKGEAKPDAKPDAESKDGFTDKRSGR
jgi:hypothetical protein